MRYSILFILFLLLSGVINNAEAQGVAINNNGAAPNSSAMLEVTASDKGILIPRVTLTGTTDDSTIQEPALSLLVYNTATTEDVTPGFYYWSGTKWQRLATIGSPGDAWGVKGNSGLDPVANFIGTTDNIPLNFRVNNQPAGKIDDFRNSVYLGTYAGSAAANFGINNTFVGDSAGRNNTTGTDNAYFGFRSGSLSSNSFANSFFGTFSGENSSSGGGLNTFIGYAAGANSPVSGSTAVGFLSGISNTGSQSVFVGAFSGQSNAAQGNTFVGYQSGIANSLGTGNAFFGFESGFTNNGGNNNSIFGFQAAKQQDSASNGSFFGYQAGMNNHDGEGNSYFGANAGKQNVNGRDNSLFGKDAGLFNVGLLNSFFGSEAGRATNLGSSNSFFGYQSGLSNTNGFENAFFGKNTGTFSTTASNNAFFGTAAGHLNTTGSANTFIGNYAGLSNEAGSFNTLLGHMADVTLGLTNATAIGAFAKAGASNTMILGSVTGINGATSTVNVGIGTINPSERLEVAGKTRTTNLQVTTGAGAGRVLQGDALGNATWVNSTSLAITEADPQVSSSVSSMMPKWNGTALVDGIIMDDGTNIGIGKTPAEKLDVNGKTKTSNLQVTTGAAAGRVLQGDALGNATWVTSTSLAITEADPQVSSSVSNMMPKWNGTTLVDGIILDDGVNIGIGKTPAEKLDVNGKTKTTTFQMTSGSTNGHVLQSDALGNGTWVASTSLAVTEADPQVSSTVTGMVPKWNGTTLADGIILDDGVNIGIGKTPAEKLDVNGKTKTTTLQVTSGAAAGAYLKSDATGTGTWDVITPAEVNAWGLTGNAGTSATVNFIGTTDAAPLAFKVANQKAGKIDPTFRNISLGIGAGDALASTVLSENSFFGYKAGFLTTIGRFNSFYGAYAGHINVTGAENCFFGYEAGKDNNDGTNNCYYGNFSGKGISGNANSFFGWGAGTSFLATGGLNVFIGANSGNSISSGSANTLIGTNTSLTIGTLENATAVGSRAMVGASNALVLGGISGFNGATADVNVGIGTFSPDTKLEVAGSNGVTSRLTSLNGSDVVFDFKRTGSDWRIKNSTGLLYIGQSSDDLATVVEVIRLGGASLTPATDNFVTLGSTSLRWTQVCAVNGTINTSDERLKKDVTGLGYGLDALMMLNPVTFRWKDGNIDNGSKHIGFLAQDLQKVLPEVVVDHEWKEGAESSKREWTTTSTLGVNYAEMTPVLVKAVQEQQQMIEQLQKEIAALKLEINKLNH
jgi:hypothetical protein